MTRIEGASPEQRALLEQILAGIPRTRIAALRVAPEYDLEPERGDNDEPLDPDWDPTKPLGDALRLVEPEWPDLRTEWELELVGAEFHRASRNAGLAPVVGVFSSQGGPHFGPRDDRRPGQTDRDSLDVDVQAAASTTGALLDRVEFVEAGGLAVAVSLAVPEAHGFLRHGLHAFLQLSGLADRPLAGAYVRVVDGEPAPVVEKYRRGGIGFGAHANRNDVRCCGRGGFSRGLTDPGPPACPFPSRTWDDMFEAYRRNLKDSTGRDLDEWRHALTEAGLTTPWERLRWLQDQGIGRARAHAIVATD